MLTVFSLNFLSILLFFNCCLAIADVKNRTVLSRKRRYLIFPEGSSFQVVFDLTYPSVGMGNLFVFGNTAAMAWELPSTPSFLDEIYRRHNESDSSETKEPQSTDSSHKKDDHKWHVLYPDKEHSWQGDTLSYEPDFAPVDSYANDYDNYSPSLTQDRRYTINNDPGKLWISNIQNRYMSRRKLDTPDSSFQKNMYHHIYRRSRRNLYSKIEKFLDALTKDGKTCILKAICQANKVDGKGNMIQEIFKAIFRVKSHKLHPNEDHYDRAANLDHDCDQLYPKCQGHMLSNLFKYARF